MGSLESDHRTSAFTSSSVPEDYERHLAPVLFAPWAEILVDAVGVAAGAEVLDVASGTGVIARLAAARAGSSGRVIASDISGAMLSHAATIPAPTGSARIEFLEASVMELPFDDDRFDVVLCQQGMPFFTDRPRAAAEMLRVLRPGGKIGLSVWLAKRNLEPFDDYIEALIEADLQPPFPGAFDSETFKMTARRSGPSSRPRAALRSRFAWWSARSSGPTPNPLPSESSAHRSRHSWPSCRVTAATRWRPISHAGSGHPHRAMRCGV
ncbi:MAG: class I SAM-dependent methyltransferase, partial [Solirubrobacteraceae bacterium]